jgi:hypothetical protein
MDRIDIASTVENECPLSLPFCFEDELALSDLEDIDD